MACAAAWLQSAVEARHRNRILLVVDEAWAILGNLGVARWLQSSWKLSRAMGVANIAVLHRLSDLASVGAAGSEQVGLAEGLLADSETRVVYAQSPGEVARTGELLGLTDTEADLVSTLPPGDRAVEGGAAVVPGRAPARPRRAWLVDTDRAMADVDGDRASGSGGPVVTTGHGRGHRHRRHGRRRGGAGRPTRRGRRRPRSAAGRRTGAAGRDGRRRAPAPAGRPGGPPGGPAPADLGDLVVRPPGAAPGRAPGARSDGPPAGGGRAGPVGHRVRPDPVPQDDRVRRAGHPRVDGPGGGGQRQGRPARAHRRPPGHRRRGPLLRSHRRHRPAGGRLVAPAGVADLARGPAGGGHAHRGRPVPGRVA